MINKRFHSINYAYFKKIVLIMKLSALFLILCIGMANAHISYSQSTLLSLNLNNSTVREVLDEIERSSEFIFFYQADDVDENRKIQIRAKGQTIDQILNQVFDQTDNVFTIDERQVYISKLSDPDLQQTDKKEISGTVTDKDGEAVIGASVLEKGTTNGIATDAQGRFSLLVNPGATLEIRYIGYITREVPIGNKTVFEIVLEETTAEIEEVVVVGYGTQKRYTVTGAVASIGNEDLQKAPAINVANALTGRLPGVSFIQHSGEPGADNPIIRIRGISSLGDPLSGANDPLILVDGVERGFNQIDPAEIENISVLKDAASTAVYGVRGANGVIIVTTKRGTTGKPRLSYSGQFGLQQPAIHLDYANAYQYAYLVNEGEANDGIGPANRTFTTEVIEKYRTNSDPYLYPNIDWMDYLLRDVSPQHKHNINIQGGAEKLKYFVSLGVLDQGGIFKSFPVGEDDYDPSFSYTRYNFRSNFDFELTSTTSLKINSGGNMGNRNGPSQADGDGNGNFWFDMQQANPFGVVGIVNGRRIFAEDRRGRADALNDLYFTGFINRYISNFNMDVSLNQSLDFLLKGLKVHGTVAYDSQYTHTKDRDKSYATYWTRADENSPNGYVILKKGQEWGMGYSEWYSKWRKMYTEVGINYERSFNNHNITALALYNQQKRWYPDLSQADIPTAYVGFVGRVTYNYGLKYLLDFNIGYNGSENFAPGKRFGLFPAVSAGWVISEERFIKEKLPFINYLKLRYSYGTVGKDNLGSARFYYLPDQYAFTGGYFFGTTTSMFPGARETSLGNPNIGWEVSKKQNYAVELSVLDQQLRLSFDYFTEKRTDILINARSVPAVVAATLPPQNLGKVDNKGYEIEMRWTQQINKFRYYIGGNFSNTENTIIFNDEPLGNYEYQWETGKPVGQHFGYKFAGFFKDQADIDNSPLYYENTKPGDAKYEDINQDGEITSADITAIGYPKYPKITYGINAGLSYNGFDFSLLFQGAAKVSIALSDEFIIPYINDGPVMAYIWDERWTPETADKATYPRMISAPSRDHNNYMPSSLWIKDASYIRLKNIDLGYTFRNKSLLNKLGIVSLRLGMNGINLLTFTPLTVCDPEARSGRVQSYPTMKTYNFNMNIEF
jgi:TonB-linked SusC/RagA family outer membrane protein